MLGDPLTTIESNYYLGINARECARRMNTRKDKVYLYYRLFKQGLIQKDKLRRKGKNNPKHHNETRGRIKMIVKRFINVTNGILKLRLIKNTGTLRETPLSGSIVNLRLLP